MYSIVIYLHTYLCRRLSMHSSVDGYLGYFRFGAMMKKAVINIYGQIFVSLCFHFFYVNTYE